MNLRCGLKTFDIFSKIVSVMFTEVLRIYEYHEAWAKEKNDVRRYFLHKFPYKILYSIESDYIYIIAVAHCHRKPEYWIERIS